jgi:hypothetical protein
VLLWHNPWTLNQRCCCKTTGCQPQPSTVTPQPLKLTVPDPSSYFHTHDRVFELRLPLAQVLLLQDYGLSAPTPRPRPLQPLKLTDPDPFLVHLADESAAYWGGLQALTGGPLLAPQQSLDVVLDPERDHPGAAGFSKLQVSCTH